MQKMKYEFKLFPLDRKKYYMPTLDRVWNRMRNAIDLNSDRVHKSNHVEEVIKLIVLLAKILGADPKASLMMGQHHDSGCIITNDTSGIVISHAFNMVQIFPPDEARINMRWSLEKSLGFCTDSLLNKIMSALTENNYKLKKNHAIFSEIIFREICNCFFPRLSAEFVNTVATAIGHHSEIDGIYRGGIEFDESIKLYIALLKDADKMAAFKDFTRHVIHCGDNAWPFTTMTWPYVTGVFPVEFLHCGMVDFENIHFGIQHLVNIVAWYYTLHFEESRMLIKQDWEIFAGQVVDKANELGIKIQLIIPNGSPAEKMVSDGVLDRIIKK